MSVVIRLFTSPPSNRANVGGLTFRTSRSAFDQLGLFSKAALAIFDPVIWFAGGIADAPTSRVVGRLSMRLNCARQGINYDYRST